MSRLLIIGITLIALLGSAWFDALGFLHAARAWRAGQFVMAEAGFAALYFSIGLLAYLVSLRFMIQLGIGKVELQAAIWFVATVCGVAVLNGSVASWAALDKLSGAGVVVLLAFLTYRVA